MSNKKVNIKDLNSINKNTMMEWMQIEYLEASEGYIKAKMPVSERVFQPMKILHGGANLALAETVAGFGSSLIVDIQKYDVRGAQVSANHIGTAKDGYVIAEATLVHHGKNTHLWNVEIKHQSGKAISTCRITNFIIKK